MCRSWLCAQHYQLQLSMIKTKKVVAWIDIPTLNIKCMNIWVFILGLLLLLLLCLPCSPLQCLWVNLKYVHSILILIISCICSNVLLQLFNNKSSDVVFGRPFFSLLPSNLTPSISFNSSPPPPRFYMYVHSNSAVYLQLHLLIFALSFLECI